MTNFSMRDAAQSEAVERLRKGSEGHLAAGFVSARGYPARMPTPTRDEAWELFCEWTESDSLRKHVLGVEAAMRAYAREYGEDEELWAATAILHDLDYEKHPDLETGPPAGGAGAVRGARLPAGADRRRGRPRHVPRRPARDADGQDAVRRRRAERFIAAVALVRPTGIEGMTPKSVKKKLKQPSFAAAVEPRRGARRAPRSSGVDFDEHLRTVIAAMEENARTSWGWTGS